MRPRQPYAVIARFRNGGPMRHRNATRGGARNEQAELLEELGSDRDLVPTGGTMKRFRIQATFFMQAADAEEAKAVAEDMLGDVVSEDYEEVEKVEVLGEVAQDEFHSQFDTSEEDGE